MARTRKTLGESQEVEMRLAKAMAHPVRVKALEMLSHRPMAPVEVADELNVPLSNVSYHFRTLLELECIKEVGQEQVRGSIKTTFESRVDLLMSKAVWGGVEGKATGELTRATLKAIGVRVTNALEAKTFERRKDIQLTVQTLELSDGQFAEVSDLMDEITVRLGEFKAANQADDSEARFPATFSMLGYESPKLYEI